MSLAKKFLKTISALVSVEADSIARHFRTRSCREREVERVLTAFRDMGATPDDLAVERQRLMEDDPYLESWADTIAA